MNGFTIDDEQHQKALLSFWELYKTVDPSHPVYTLHASKLDSVIPLMYHGDEGRGQLKRAVLVTSFVAVLATSGHPFLSRFLCTVYPGERYGTGDDGVETLEALHAEVARDLNDLLEYGFEVPASKVISTVLFATHALRKTSGCQAKWFQEENLRRHGWCSWRLAVATHFAKYVSTISNADASHHFACMHSST